MRGKDILEVFGRFRLISYILSILAIVLCTLTWGNHNLWSFARRLLTLPGLVAAFNICARLLDNKWLKDSPLLAECSFPVFAGHAIGIPMIDLLVNKLIPGTGDFICFLKYLLRPTIIILIIVVVFFLCKRFFPKTTALFTGGRS